MIDAAIYKQVMGSFPSGVTVITTLDDDGQIVGLTASAFSSLSMDPALVLFCPNYSSDSYPVLIKNKRFAIHVLSAGQQSEAYAFARKGKDKAQGIEWTLSALGNPILANATAVIECELWREYEGGDHAIMVGSVKNLIVPQQNAGPLVCTATARWAPCRCRPEPHNHQVALGLVLLWLLCALEPTGVVSGVLG